MAPMVEFIGGAARRKVKLTDDVLINRADEVTPGAVTEVRVRNHNEAYQMRLARDLVRLYSTTGFTLIIDHDSDGMPIYNGRQIDQFEQELSSNQLEIIG